MEKIFNSVPTVNHRPLIEFSDAPYVEFTEVVEEPLKTVHHVNFLEANTDAISMQDLTSKCVVPTWGNQELTIAHQDFINTVLDAAKSFYHGEIVEDPDVRVSHPIHGRVPSALGKKTSELLDSEKTLFYQRLAFAFTIPTIYETVAGEKVELCVGGVRNYNDMNLYRSSRGAEKFSVFVGWRVNICSNQMLTGDGLKLQMEVTSLHDLYQRVLDLLHNYNPAKEIHLMQTLCNTSMTETQFAQIVGRCRLYQALPKGHAIVPQLLITDSQINSVCRGFYENTHFGMKDNELSMWQFHNLLTEANKSSYIDSYLQRAVNATDLAVGINNALKGEDTRYSWFLG